MGLPWRSQVSLEVPYVWNDFGQAGTSDGLGDAGVLFTKELIGNAYEVPGWDVTHGVALVALG